MAQISHIPCPDKVHCKSSDAYSWNSTDCVGYCHACSETFFDMELPLNRKNRDMQQETTVVQIGGNYEYTPMRGITKSTMEFYDVKTFKAPDGNVARQEYVYPSGGKKIRYFPKSFSAQGLQSDELFGMNLWNAGCAKYVTITEGEVDALSAYQMLLSNYVNPVVSLPSATPSKKLWENCREWLNSFEKIIVSFDNDQAGDAVAARMANMFPNKVYRVPHDKFKDANEFLKANAAAEYKSAWWNAKKFVPENVLNTSEQFLKLFRDTPEHQFVPTGIQALDDKIMGLMQGHFTVIKAPTGIGKTEVMRYLEYNLIQRGIPFASWHLEETKLRSLLGLVSYKLEQNLTRRDLIDHYDATERVEKAIIDITKPEKFYQFYLADGQGPDDLIEQIRFFRGACDCQFIFFEPIQDVVSGFSEEGKEQMLADLSVRLSKLAAELNVGIVTIAHTNDNGDPKYCKMIGQRASVVIDLARDRTADNADDRNLTYLRVEKNRPCSEEGPAGVLRFNPETFTLSETYHT